MIRLTSPLVAVVVAASLTGSDCGSAAARLTVPPLRGTEQLELYGTFVLPSARHEDGGRPDVGGLSGAWYDPQSKQLFAVSDDQERPRVLRFSLRLAPSVSLTRVGLIPLRRPEGGGRTLDAEAIAPAPDGHVFVTSEGAAGKGSGAEAGIYEYARDGRFVRKLPLPAAYLSDDGGGLRHNAGLESLTASPSGRRLFTATESSLAQDGAHADVDHGVTARVLAYERPFDRGRPREYAYRLDAVPRPPDYAGASGNNGISDLLALSDTDLLVLERGFVEENALTGGRRSNVIRLYRVSLTPAAEVTGIRKLDESRTIATLAKTLVLDLATFTPQMGEAMQALENFEAIAFGPRLPDGRSSLLLLSDDNFSSRQATACVVLAFRSLRTQ